MLICKSSGCDGTLGPMLHISMPMLWMGSAPTAYFFPILQPHGRSDPLGPQPRRLPFLVLDSKQCTQVPLSWLPLVSVCSFPTLTRGFSSSAGVLPLTGTVTWTPGFCSSAGVLPLASTVIVCSRAEVHDILFTPRTSHVISICNGRKQRLAKPRPSLKEASKGVALESYCKAGFTKCVLLKITYRA